MGIFASLVPGVRELRAPLAAGYLWLLAGWLALASWIDEVDKETGTLGALNDLKDATTVLGFAVAVSFVAYLLGSVSEAVFRKQLETRVAVVTYLVAAAVRSARRRWFSIGHPRFLLHEFTREVESRVRYGLSDKGSAGVALLSRRVLAELEEAGLPVPRMANEYVGETVASESEDDFVRQALASELDLVERRLIGTQPALYAEADRLRAEHEFRLAIVPPLVVLVIVLAVKESPAWLVGLIPIALLYVQGLLRREARTDFLVDLLLLGTVRGPTQELMLRGVPGAVRAASP